MEGDAFRDLVIESDRALVSTGKQTLVVSRGGDILDLHEPPRIGRDHNRSSLRIDNRCELEKGELLERDAQGVCISRTEIPFDPFEPHFTRRFAGLPLDEAALRDHMVDRWWRYVALVADPTRGRLLAFNTSIPWLAAIRTDGRVDWALDIGVFGGCCNSGDIVAGDGTFAHLSMCDARITFVSAEGQIVSAHAIGAEPRDLWTDGRGVAYVTLSNEGIAAYRPMVGRTRTLEIPHVRRTQVKDGILYAVVEDPSDGFMLKAFQART